MSVQQSDSFVATSTPHPPQTVGPVLVGESAATTDTLRGGVKHFPRNVVRMEDQRAAAEVGLEGPQSHPRRNDLVARRPLGTPSPVPPTGNRIGADGPQGQDHKQGDAPQRVALLRAVP
ncbi:hypothetical protein GCM10017668_24690 [Streptomyces tuirus]|uniref:Uncharacterized protein n=1 Tax=Streptomyces tuirus TaxID=68278 RepID=A0A7G1NG85_9ACTN|nr:hypothetical protein GCM10017668_24690 [Streptomyces tuirus]